MPDNILKAIIKVDAPGVEQAFKIVSIGVTTTERGLSNLQKQLIHFGGGVKTFTSGFTSLAVPLKALPKATDAVVVSMKRLTPTAKAATQSMINLGRVVQDAPFGFLGIANNLNPLLESFQRLRATTGSTGLALKALGSSLIGAGGIGFALSIVSSLMLVFGTNLFGAGKKAKEAKEPVNELAEAQKKLKQELEAAAQAVVSQAGNFESLKKVLIDVSNEYLTLGDAITKQGIAQFLFSQKEGLVKELLTKQIATQLKIQKELNSAREFVPKSTRPLIALRLPTEEDEKNLRKIGIGLNPIEKKIFDINVLAESLGLSFDRFVKTAVKGGKETAFEYDELAHIFEKLLKLQEVFSDQLKALQDIRIKIRADFGFGAGAAFENFSKEVKVVSDVLQKEVDRLTKNNPILIQAQLIIDEGKKAAADLQANFENVAKIISDTVAPAFGNLFSAILKGEQPLKAFFNSLIQGVEQLISKLISAAIQAAILSLLTGGGGANSFAALFKGFLGFRAHGGPVQAGGSYIVGEDGPELFVPNTGGSIIPNTGLNGRAMAGDGTFVTGELLLRGQNLVASLAATNRSQRRLG